MATVGLYAEFFGAGLPSAKPLLGPPHADQAWVIDYLEAGHVVAFVPEVFDDPFTPGQIAGSASLFTDGTWVWPGLLAYLVRVHGLALPSDFVDHMRQNDFNPPELDPARLTELSDAISADIGPPQVFPEELARPDEEER